MEVPRRQFGWRLVLAAIVVFVFWYVFLQPEAEELDASEKAALLQLARQQLVATAAGEELLDIDESSLPDRLLLADSAFVTLTLDGELRGCMIDAFEPHEPLYHNVLRNTALAAREDERFAPVSPEEVEHIRIAISVLTPPKKLAFDGPEELVAALEPGVDGVILTLNEATSTYLPEVWETFPDPSVFLSRLSEKAGLPADRWREVPFPTVQTYHVLRFAES